LDSFHDKTRLSRRDELAGLMDLSLDVFLSDAVLLAITGVRAAERLTRRKIVMVRRNKRICRRGEEPAVNSLK